MNETTQPYIFADIRDAGAAYGKSDTGQGKRVLVEFVSAQPNTTLTVTHGRGGVVGDVIAALLAATGYDVQREFYVNDSNESRPLRAFARAVLSLYRQRCGVADSTPEAENYSGDYVSTVAERIYEDVGETYAAQTTTEALPIFLRLALERTQKDQREVLSSLQIQFDNWTLESELAKHGSVMETLDALEKSGRAELRGEALWLKSSLFGDSHDHVLSRADGSTTYLAGDLAYHRGKFERGYDRLVDVWSADHATYVPRTRAGIAAMGFDPAHIDFVVFQPVRVLKDGTEIKGGRENSQSAVPLTELIDAVGAEAARFQLAIEDPANPLDLSIDAPSGRTANGAARVKRAIEKALEISNRKGAGDKQGNAPDPTQKAVDMLRAFPDTVAQAAATLAPQLIPQYALGLTVELESLLETGQASGELFHAAAITLENALVLLGIPPGPSVVAAKV